MLGNVSSQHRVWLHDELGHFVLLVVYSRVCTECEGDFLDNESMVSFGFTTLLFVCCLLWISYFSSIESFCSVGSVLKKCPWWRCLIIKELTLSGRDSLHLNLWFLTNSSVHTKMLNTMEMELCNITILELNCTFSPFLPLRDWASLIILYRFANIPIGIFGISVLQPIYI